MRHADASRFAAYGALMLVVAGGMLYVFLQFRGEIGRFFKRRFKWSRKIDDSGI